MYRHLTVTFFSVLLLFSASKAEAGFWDTILKRLGLISSETSLSEDKIIAGLKEALSVGTENSVELTGKVDGYLANNAIKILLPENIARFEENLRMLGAGEYVDSFILSMNRAAEKAAPRARAIFADAIKKITFDDARKLLSGGDTAITDFFKSKTYENLLAAFAPVVDKELDNYGVTAKYKSVADSLSKVPFASELPVVDIKKYVTSKALDGLFHVLADEEKNIRRNPAARVTSLLKEVFK